MRKAQTLTFGTVTSTVANTQQYKPGDLLLNAGKVIRYLTLKLVFTLTNGSGSTHALSAAEATAFLADCQVTLRHGKVKPRTVFDNLRLDYLRKIARYVMGQDWRGVSDSTANVGLLQSLTNTSSGTVTLFIELPLGIQYQDEGQNDVGGCGPEQVGTFQLDFKLAGSGLPTGYTISAATVTAELVERSIKEASRWENIPEVRSYTEQKNRWETPEDAGLVLLFAETSATNAASTLTNLRVRVADEIIHEQVSAAEIGQDFSMDPGMPTTGDLTADWDLFIGYNTRQKVREYLPGKVVVDDVAGNMAGSNKSLVCYYRPNLTEAELRAEVGAITKAANRSWRAVPVADAIGITTEPVLKHFYGLAFLPPSEADGKGLAGLNSNNGSPALAVVSPIQRARLKNVLAVSGNGSATAHEEIAKVTASIPGGNTDAARFRKSGKLAPSVAMQSVANSIASA